MRRSRIVGLSAVTAAALVACNLLTGLDKDYALGGDGGTTPGTEAGGSEGGPDGASPDSTTSGDGSVPDASLVDASFCTASDAAAAIFCDDFEDGSVNDAGVPRGWTNRRNDPDSSFAIAPGNGMDASGGLEAKLWQNGQPSRVVWLQKSLGPIGTHYEAEFDFRVASSTFVYVVLVSLAFPSGTDQDHGVAAEDNGSSFRGLNAAGTPVGDIAGNWHHARVVLDKVDGGIFGRQLYIDGTLVESSGNHNVGISGQSELRLGAFFTPNGTTGQVQVTYDNVVIRRK